MVKFCPTCNNIMIPKNKKLFCKTCEQEFDLDTKKEEDFKLTRTIRHNEKEAMPIIAKEGHKPEKIDNEDRKSFEEFFGTYEESGSGS